MKRWLQFALIACVVLFTGCGTMLNLAEPKASPYGGVWLDAKIIAQGVPQGPSAFTGDIDIPSFWPLALVDIPLSLVGDTLTLPLTIMAVMQKQHE